MTVVIVKMSCHVCAGVLFFTGLIVFLFPSQSRDRIINGSHPCTKEEAVLFAAYQCQVQLGNHNEAKHKPGFLK